MHAWRSSSSTCCATPFSYALCVMRQNNGCWMTFREDGGVTASAAMLMLTIIEPFEFVRQSIACLSSRVKSHSSPCHWMDFFCHNYKIFEDYIEVAPFWMLLGCFYLARIIGHIYYWSMVVLSNKKSYIPTMVIPRSLRRSLSRSPTTISLRNSSLTRHSERCSCSILSSSGILHADWM